jgi:hypothetical protein
MRLSARGEVRWCPPEWCSISQRRARLSEAATPPCRRRSVFQAFPLSMRRRGWRGFFFSSSAASRLGARPRRSSHSPTRVARHYKWRWGVRCGAASGWRPTRRRPGCGRWCSGCRSVVPRQRLRCGRYRKVGGLEGARSAVSMPLHSGVPAPLFRRFGRHGGLRSALFNDTLAVNNLRVQISPWLTVLVGYLVCSGSDRCGYFYLLEALRVNVLVGFNFLGERI